jgi:hypothetical protein
MRFWTIARRGMTVGLLVTACGRTPTFAAGDGGSSSGGEESSSSGDEVVCDPELQNCTSVVTLQRAADILFIIDNSGSMGEEQGVLAANFPQFINVLEGEQVGASYRIGVATSDEIGLRATSCRQRLGDFIWEGLLGPNDQPLFVDEREEGCLNACQFDDVPLSPTVQPDGSVVSGPWIERSSGTTNLPPGVSMAEALKCLGPQGINGFGYEAPLETMRRIVEENADGFVRDDALLAIIIVTDEADCSLPIENVNTLFSALGEPFWADLEPNPTSSACWKAGVDCIGGPGQYDTCIPVDKGWDGLPTTDPNGSVLYPLQRYIDALQAVSDRKEALGGNGTISVAVIAGVPEDYPQGGELLYRDSADPIFNSEYGIGPGCGYGTETLGELPGIPPVRLKAFAEAFAGERRNMFSICSVDYAVALEQIADEIAQLGSRSCIPGCAYDSSPNVAGLQPECTVVEQRGEGEDLAVPPCVVTNDGWQFPTGLDICYRALTDADGSTAWPHDDLTPQCGNRGSNLEFVIERREGVPVPPGVGVQVECVLIGQPDERCDEV